MPKIFYRVDRDRLLSMKRGDTLAPDEFPLIDGIYRISGNPAPTRWFVAQCNPNCEGKAERGLAEIGADAYQPRLVRWRTIPERRRGPRGARREPMSRPLFPGYLFLGWSHVGEPPWLNLRRVEGIRDVLRPIDMARMTVMVLELRGAEMVGDFDECTKRGRRFKIGKLAPQFIDMSEADRVRDLMRRVRGVPLDDPMERAA